MPRESGLPGCLEKRGAIPRKALDLLNHPDIAEAAVIGRYHPKWTERPLLIVVLQPEKSLSRDEVMEFLQDKLHKMARPDDVVFVDELPHTATGKISKIGFRKTFEDYQFPAA